MSPLTKVFIVLTSILSIVLSCLFVSAAAQWDNWRDLAQTYQQQRDAALSHEQNAVASALASVSLKDEAIAGRDLQITELKKSTQEQASKLAELTSRLAQVENERQAFEAGRTKLQEILDVTAGQLKSMEKQRDTLLTQNIDTQTRNSRLNDRVLELTTQVTILTDENRNLQEKLYAAENKASEAVRAASAARSTPRTVEPAAGTVAAKPSVVGQIKGTITEVTGTYAGIDVGESSGVVTGMTFMVSRGGTYLGDLVIDKVRPGASGGKLVALVQGEVRKGDSVTYASEQ